MAPFIFAFLLCFGFIQAEVKGASPLQGFCQCNLELILDTSCSIPVSARPHILKFADELLNSNFKSAGVIKYDRYVQVVSTPTTTSSAKKALKQFADDLWCNRGEECCNTRTDKALKAAEEQVRSNNNGACNLVVLLTDGNTFPRDYKSYTVAAANSLKRVPDVTVVTVGVGQSIDPEELIAVATSKQHVILKDDFHLIQASDVCPPAATPSPSNAFGICGCDVEIVIDTSCSIPVSARDDILKFANELLDSNFKSAGIVAYDKYVRVISEQTTTSKAKSIIERLPDSFWCARGDDCCNTRTDKALTVVEDQVRKFSGGGCKTIILVTDGNTFPSSYKDDTISAANYIHRAHPDWTVITVGVGRSIDTSELAAIASGEGNKNVVLTADFHLLKAGDVCPSKPVILPPPIPQVPTPSRPPVVPPVEVPCQLSEWGAWSECSATCGSFGTRTSVRTIVKNGKDCGVTSRTESCNAIACPTPCESLAWGAWSECSKSCGVGIQQRTKGGAAASKGGVKGGSSPSCPVITETQACNTQPCVVDCVMSDWDSWTECSASCGGGRRQQTRTVQVQASNGGKQCGASIQFEACNTQACPVDCILGAWSQFTQCTVSCGGGNRQQSRPVVVAASAGGKQCESTSRSESCNTQACPIDCVMSEWTSFSECSVSCGNGKRQRSRSITVAPANGGKECGASVQVEACNTQACPVDCVMSSWTEWSECSASCGGGKKQRSRSIVVVPSAGGKACDVSVDVTGCGERPCPVDCVMSSWTGWSECSATCGGALQFRTRTIVTSPANGGADCQESSQVKTCADVPCPIPAPVPPRPVPVPVNPTQPTPSQGGFRPGEDNNSPVPTQPAPIPTQPVHVPTQPVPVPTQPAPVPTQPWGVPSWPSKGGSKGGGSKGGLKENNNSVNQFNAVPFLGGAVVGVVVVAVVVLVIAIVKKPTTRPIETSLNLL